MELTDAWRCDGPCGQLMYDLEVIDGLLYPTETAPPGFYIANLNARVCHICWELYNIIAKKEYWQEVSEKDKDKKRKLGRNGNYLA